MLVLLTGTSFSGKSTMQNLLIQKGKLGNQRVKLFKTCTTRKLREYEKDNPDRQPYYFMSQEEFENAISNNEFFEYVKISKGSHDDFYGSRTSDISNAINEDSIFVAVFEPLGALKIKQQFPQTEVVFIKPPSITELLKRAEERNTETLADIRARIDRAENIELKYENDFDFKVLNANKEQCFTDICNYLKKNNI